MLWEDVYISACASVLGDREDVAAAVTAGRYAPEAWAADGYLSVSVTDDGPAMDLAVDAACIALSRSDVDITDIRLIIHASCGPQGPEHIAPASYIQGRAVGGTGCALEVKQFSNGGMAALDLAAAYLTAVPASPAALLTTSDTFRPPKIDRYRSDPGNILADGATGLVLTRGHGLARLVCTTVIGDGSYSDVRVGDGDSSDADRERFLVEHGQRLLQMVGSMSALQRESIELTLAPAGLDCGDIDRWVFANVGLAQVDQELRKALDIDESTTTWEWGRTVGHLGAGDQFAGLTHLLDGGAVRAGDRIALCGMGSGFSFSCAVVEVLREPAWSCEVIG